METGHNNHRITPAAATHSFTAGWKDERGTKKGILAFICSYFNNNEGVRE